MFSEPVLYVMTSYNQEATMEKFKLAHTTKSPRIVKPIQKPKQRSFQKNIKELLAGRTVSSIDTRQDKNKENALKLLTDASGKVQERSNILISLEKKKLKSSKKKTKNKASFISNAKDTDSEHGKSRRVEDSNTSSSNKPTTPNGKTFHSLKSVTQTEEEVKPVTNFNQTATHRGEKNYKKAVTKKTVKQHTPLKKKFDRQSCSTVHSLNKGELKGSALSDNREDRRTTEENVKGQISIKKLKSHKNKKQEKINIIQIKATDIQKENVDNQSKHTENGDYSSKEKADKTRFLHQRKIVKFVCKKALSPKAGNINHAPFVKIKNKTKKKKDSFGETTPKVCLPTDRSLSLIEETVSVNKVKKKKKKRKSQQKSIPRIDTSSVTGTEDLILGDLNSLSRCATGFTGKVKLSKQKPEGSKETREAFIHPSSIVDTNLQSTHGCKHDSVETSDADALMQHSCSHLRETKDCTNKLPGLDVEIVDINDPERNGLKEANVITHKSRKENEYVDKESKRLRRISFSKVGAEQVAPIDTCKRLKGKKTKNLKEKHASKENVSETQDDLLNDTHKSKKQPHSGLEGRLDSAPLVVNLIDTTELPEIPDIFHTAEDICSPEKEREIHSVIQQFIPDILGAENIVTHTISLKNTNSDKAANDIPIKTISAVPDSAKGISSKTRKRKLSREVKYHPETTNMFKDNIEGSKHEDDIKNKIPSQPLIVTATNSAKSFQIPTFLDNAADESHSPTKNTANIHSVVHFLLSSQENDSFFENSFSSGNSKLKGVSNITNSDCMQNAQDQSSCKQNLNTISDTVDLEHGIQAVCKSPLRNNEVIENSEINMESTLEKEAESTIVFQDLSMNDSSANRQNISTPLLVEMSNHTELSPVPAVFDDLPIKHVSSVDDICDNFLTKHITPTSHGEQSLHLKGSHSIPSISTINSATGNKRKKSESETEQQEQLLDKKEEYDETDNDSVTFYSIPNSSKFLLFMKYPSLLYFKGKLTVSVLSGIIEVLGFVIKSGENKHVVYSPKGSSLMSLQTCESDENELVNYDTLKEKLVILGMNINIIKGIVNNFGQRDCLVILEQGPTTNLDEFVKKLPPDMHLFDVSNVNLKDKNPRSCLYKAQKKLGCIFELASSNKSFRRYVKSPEWDELIQEIIRWNLENLKNGPVSTAVCGGKGVGKSTFLRYFVNKCLTEFDKVLWLDFDPGQAEFIMPGCVAAVVVSEPLLGPNFTHLRTAERMVFVGDVNISQCPIQYLQSVEHVLNYCRSQPELRKMPWLVNTMGFCKGLGIDLIASIIRMLRPHKVVQIQSSNFKCNFPNLLTPEYVGDYPTIWRAGPMPGKATLKYSVHVINTMTDSTVAENTGQWGMEPRRQREAVILSYLSQMAKAPRYSLFDLVPYMTFFHKLTLCICHRPVQYEHMLAAMNGNLVALCFYNGNEALVPNDPELPKILNRQSICPCLGFGIVRGIDIQEKKLFLITPIPEQVLHQVNCLMMGAVMLPAYLYTAAEKGMGQVPYVSSGPGQPTSKAIRRFFRPLEEKSMHKE